MDPTSQGGVQRCFSLEIHSAMTNLKCCMSIFKFFLLFLKKVQIHSNCLSGIEQFLTHLTSEVLSLVTYLLRFNAEKTLLT